MVEGTALEMRRRCKPTVGSNPTPSASKKGALCPLFTGGLGSVNGPALRLGEDEEHAKACSEQFRPLAAIMCQLVPGFGPMAALVRMLVLLICQTTA